MISRLSNVVAFLGSFIRTRWGYRFKNRKELIEYQEKKLKDFAVNTLPNTRFYRHLAAKEMNSLPIVNKEVMLGAFDAFNCHEISLLTAQTVALRAEEERNFSPTLRHGITVGLSSGTSGKRSVFLLSERERHIWAGAILARALSRKLLCKLCNPFMPAVRVAFFLRSNSNLYTTVDSVGVRFRFFDLLVPLREQLQDLASYSPDILIAPASVLHQIACAQLQSQVDFHPVQVISVAEVLEHDDQQVIERAWNVPVQQIYQCTEGFLGYTCSAGSLHLNEEFVHFEPVWIDKDGGRFEAIITDFTRHTQIFARFRMDDILQSDHTSCACGRHSLRLKAIEGRHDDVLWLPNLATGQIQPVFPDQLRRAMMLAQEHFDDYRIEQLDMHIKIGLRSDGCLKLAENAVKLELGRLWKNLGLQSPTMSVHESAEFLQHLKRRRIRCMRPPMVATAFDLSIQQV